MIYLNTATCVHCNLLQVHPLSKCGSIKQTWEAGSTMALEVVDSVTVAFDLVTLSTLKTWPLKSP